jgi:tRNA A37 N6-isopentenylltransferase MiaA
LHERIALRFKQMLQQGLVAEVEDLYQRGDLTVQMPSVRAVGYRQVWSYLEGDINVEKMQEMGVIATRQLAKRQFTWLRRVVDAQHVVGSSTYRSTHTPPKHAVHVADHSGECVPQQLDQLIVIWHALHPCRWLAPAHQVVHVMHLAKRQFTWLRRVVDAHSFYTEERDVFSAVLSALKTQIKDV